MVFSTLTSCRLFEGLAEAEIEKLLTSVHYKVARYEKDQPVFHLMDDADHVAIILQGSIQAQKIFPSGKAMQVTVGRCGDMLGQAAMFSVQRKCPVELTALEPSELLMLDRENMLKLLHADVRLLDAFLSELATATFQLQWRIELLSYSGIQQKIAFYLLSQSMQSGDPVVQIPSSITKWALSMNVSRPSLHRELKELEDQGLIAVSSPHITIQDSQALRRILG
ncbi:MAG: Crp/Fnr family transcriptional regulator [Oscillospiraceae bacterium]|nr:Crp/Fnr family transcriptional regulator [Oscillospiraceae bacterium]